MSHLLGFSKANLHFFSETFLRKGKFTELLPNISFIVCIMLVFFIPFCNINIYINIELTKVFSHKGTYLIPRQLAILRSKLRKGNAFYTGFFVVSYKVF